MASSAPGRGILLPVYLSAMGTWAAYAMVVVVLPFRFEELGLSVVEYGTALAAYALGTLLTEGLWGYLAFRVGSTPALAGLGAVTAASMLALGFAHTFGEFTLLLGLYGALVVYSTPLIRWLGMNASGAGTASQGLGRLGLFFGVGISAGTAAGPLLYSIGGFWLNVSLGTLIFALATVPLVRLPWKSVTLPRHRPTGQSAFRAVFERQFVLASLLVVLYFVVYTVVTNFLQYYSIGLFHGTMDDAGYVIGAVRAVALVTGLLLGSSIDRWGPARAAPMGFLLLAAGALGTWVSSTYLEMALASLVLATGAGCLGVSLLPLALSRIPHALQGTAVGVFGSFEDLGLVVGPVLLGVVYSTLSPRDLFPVAAAISLGALLLALVSRTPAGPTARLPESPGNALS